MAKKISIKGSIIPNANKWIYDWFGMDSTSPNDIQNIIDSVIGNEDLEIEINSPGGSVSAGSEIYTKLRNYNKGNITINIVGTACSAAAFIASIPNAKCYISPTALIMWHRTSTSIGTGNIEDLQKVQNMLSAGDRAVANAFMAKTGKTLNEAIEVMSKETWYSAQEAVDAGLANGIMFDEKESNLVLNNSFSNGIIPDEIINKMNKEKSERLENLEKKYNKLKGGI